MTVSPWAKSGVECAIVSSPRKGKPTSLRAVPRCGVCMTRQSVDLTNRVERMIRT